MLNIEIMQDRLIIKNISRDSLQSMYDIYSNTEMFKYATGVYNLVDYNQFFNEISTTLYKENTFFLNIQNESQELLGFIKGEVLEENRLLWINSLVIDIPFQSRGIGSKTMSILERFFKKEVNVNMVYLSVSKENYLGVKFWNRCGYRFSDNLTNKVPSINHNAVIMCKNL